MSKVRAVVNVAKKCIKEPKYIKKGLTHIKYNGLSGLRERVRGTDSLKKGVTYVVPSDPNASYWGDIKFSIVMPVYNVEIKWLDKAIESVKKQNYQNWELCIADDCSTKPEVKVYLNTIHDDRIKIKYLEKNGGISAASNEAAGLATGDYLVLMDNDDEITYDALYEFLRVAKDKNADVIYSDQGIIDANGKDSNPLYKPDWSPELFLSQMYLGHLVGFKRSLFEKVGGFRSEFNGSQDYDLLWRIIENSETIEHVSKILYRWRAIPSSTATNPDSKPYAQTAGLNAVQGHLDRILGEGKATAVETEDLFVYDVRYNLDKMPMVSVIIPIKDHADLLAQLMESIAKKNVYDNYEVIILNNNSVEQETFEYLEKLTSENSKIKVVDAAYQFNWSRLNNHGMKEAKGDVFIFMNNDMEIISEDWMLRLVEKAVQPEIGVVGGLLLYEDDTIQHAGVVVGINGFADHVYKGYRPVHYGSPFISPMVTRNVLSVTGALMAISRDTLEQIGKFDDDFIICGSDVELCIRAWYSGYRNVYDPHVKLYHYESKSRDSYIPEVDFELSEFAYRNFNDEGDPYYNIMLDYSTSAPKVAKQSRFQLVESDFMNYVNKKVSKDMMREEELQIPEILKYSFRKSEFSSKRINLLVPSINEQHVFGGISTALKFFEELLEKSGCASRIILTDAFPSRKALKKYGKKYKCVHCEKDSDELHQIVPYCYRYQKSLPVSENDIFMFTGWWTAYCTQEAYAEFGVAPNPYIYFIQDYEPGFYPWSTRYLLADSTYRDKNKQIAIFNSELLYAFFKQNDYSFYKEYAFEPVLNAGLKTVLMDNVDKKVTKKKKILVYGRPTVERNAFTLVVSALRKLVEKMSDANDWEFVSAGEYHDKVSLGKGKYLESVGKLTITQYAEMMMETYAGISLMSSPHPSYPPLEMSEFGVKVITNTYANKDLSVFNDNIISVQNVSPDNIAEQLNIICSQFDDTYVLKVLNPEYVTNDNVFSFIEDIVEEIK